MERMKLAGRWVLVTGASSGLGREMARVLARRGANLIVVGRRLERLQELQHELSVKVLPVAADLAKLSDVDRVVATATEAGVYAAILNAGVTHFGDHHELAWPNFEEMLATNVTSVVRMTGGLLPQLERAGGGLMLISSLAGVSPVAYQTAYSATKAFLNAYGCGMWHELQGRNVSITTVTPGGIDTEMTATARFHALKGWLMPAERCASECVDAMVRREYVFVPSLSMRAAELVGRVLPRKWLTAQIARTYRAALRT